MRTVLRYEQGRAIWSDNEPSAAHLTGIRGTLVRGAPGAVEQARINSRIGNAEARARLAQGAPPPAPKPRADRARVYATDEERLAARAKSFRESKARRRAELRAERNAA